MAEPERVSRPDLEDLSPEAVQRAWEKMCEEASERICYNCASLVWAKRLYDDGKRPSRVPIWPICADHADTPGVPREVHPALTCSNFRPKPKPALRVMPPKPERATDRYIPLTRGLWAVVDVADFERLNKYRWYASPSGGGKMYARRNTKTGTVLMHREIMKTPKGKHVDHKDRNGLNNRPDNLRNCTPQQNEYNKRPRGRKSRFKGVYPRGNKWYAAIKHKGKTYYLGTFDDEVEAAKARDRKAYELEGEFAYLNFPEEILGKGKAGRQDMVRRAGKARGKARAGRKAKRRSGAKRKSRRRRRSG